MAQQTKTAQAFDPYNCGDLSMFRQTIAQELTREETTRLMRWCDCQTEALWDGMTLQEILNVYHVSREFDAWESWAQEEDDIARKAWNGVVTPANHLQLLNA